MPVEPLPSIFGMRPLDINRVVHKLDSLAPIKTMILICAVFVMA